MPLERVEEVLKLVALAEFFGQAKMSLAHVAEQSLHLVDGTGHPVRDEDARDSDADDEQRQHDDEHHEHLRLLVGQLLRALLQ